MISADFGVRVRAAREAAGLSQAEVARQLGINRMYYSLFEAGRYVPCAAEAEALRSFGVEIGVSLGPAMPAVGPTLDHTPPERPIANVSVGGNAAGCLQSKADAALNAIRGAAVDGLRSKRLVRTVIAARDALDDLDYAELLAACSRANFSTAGLVSVSDYEQLDVNEKIEWEARASGLLVCDALYGTQWSEIGFDGLKRLESTIQAALPLGDQLKYRQRSLLDIVFGDAEEFCPIRRVDLAPYVVRLACSRAAPAILSGPPDL
jgi:transcriptional regulator with XRE-family HTH domain